MNKALITRFLKLPRIALFVLAVFLCFVPQTMSITYTTMISRIMLFAVYAMAYDILRGYAGIIHLGFALFIGGGAYFVGILLARVEISMLMVLVAFAGVTVYSAFWALLVGRIASKSGSLLATAMITMAFGEIMRNVMERWRNVTNGLDGLNYRVPFPFNNRAYMYYGCFIFLILMGFLLYKFVNSPTGRMVQAIRENDQRAVFLGYDVNRGRTIAMLVASITGGMAGVMFGLLNRFINTDLLNMQMTYNAMLYSMIGGSGTLFGAIVGSVVVIFFQNMLLDLRSVHFIFERWLLFFGALYIVVIMFMPQGIVGFINSWLEKYRQKRSQELRTKQRDQ